jgi:hypothetical protein
MRYKCEVAFYSNRYLVILKLNKTVKISNFILVEKTAWTPCVMQTEGESPPLPLKSIVALQSRSF